MKLETIILDKRSVNSSYHYWDHYRYDHSQLVYNAIIHYSNKHNLGIGHDNFYDVKEYSTTYHVKIIKSEPIRFRKR